MKYTLSKETRVHQRLSIANLHQMAGLKRRTNIGTLGTIASGPDEILGHRAKGNLLSNNEEHRQAGALK